MPSRPRTYRVEAVVLRHNDWGEADRILTLFTKEMGKLRAVAKGVRKIRSRKAGHLEPFTHVNLLLAKGRDLPLVTQAETVQAYLPLRSALLLPTYASYIVELLDRFTYEEGENPALFRLAIDTLSRLSRGDSPDLVVRYYEIRLLDLVGFRPRLFQCSVCESEVQPVDQFFSAEQGGVVCPDCAERPQNSALLHLRPISIQALKYLRHFQRSNYTEASRAVLTPSLNREMENLTQHYITYVLERGLNTPAFLRRARGGEQLLVDAADEAPPTSDETPPKPA
jgi:DNA repair protein RecO (recombination protein O)